MKIKYELISASGNPTAIIYGRFSPAEKQKINKLIFENNALVEQIGYLFYENENKMIKFEMMGNEFSGNGCRAAAFSLLKMKPGIIKFKTSGLNKIINASIGNDLTSNISLPCLFDKNKIICNRFGFAIKMFGSSLIVIEDNKNDKIVQEIVNELSKKSRAIGIMFIEICSRRVVKLNPFFYVKETNTLINETACGSGSIACAIYQNLLNPEPSNILEVLQPSGESIFVKTGCVKKAIREIEISGPTKLLGNYEIFF